MRVSFDIVQSGQEYYVSHLAPYEIRRSIRIDEACAIVAMTESEAGKRVPAGLIIFMEEPGGEIRLLWLFVSEEFRFLGIAKRLISYFVRFEPETEKVILLSEENMQDGTVEDMARFFKRLGFKKEKTSQVFWSVTKEELEKCEFVETAEGQRENHKGVYPLRECTRDEIDAAMGILAVRKKGILSIADKELSCAIKDVGMYRGALIVGKSGTEYHLLLLNGTNRRVERRLLKSAFLRLKEEMREGDRLIADVNVPRAAEWMEKIFGGEKRTEALLLSGKGGRNVR